MEQDARKHLDEDVLAWAVIGAIFGGVTLALWGTLVWNTMS
jgi:hypothetical protein